MSVLKPPTMQSLQTRALNAFVSRLHGQDFKGGIHSPEDPEYATWHHRFMSRLEVQPPIIIVPENKDDVIKAVHAASLTDVEVAIQCGGNNGARASVTSDGVLMHLGKLRHVEVDEANKIAHIGGGCLWSDVYNILEGTQLEAVGASLGIIGVGGFLTMGGYSCWSGMHGMGCDNVIAVELINGNGDIVEANTEVNPDVLWGVRGGMCNLGVVTRFTVQLHERTGEVHFGNLIFPEHQADKLLKAVESFVEMQTRQQVCIVTFARPQMVGQPCIILTFWVYGSRENFDATLAPILKECTPIFSHLAPPSTQNEFSTMGAAVFNQPGKPRRHSHHLRVAKHFTADFAKPVWKSYIEVCRDPRWQWSYATFELHNLSVLSENEKGTSTAWTHRYRHVYSLIDILYHEAADDADADLVVNILSSAYEDAHRSAFGGLGTSTWTTWNTQGDNLEASYGSSLDRLRAIKQKHDSKNVFAFSNSVAGPKPLSLKSSI